MTHAQALALWYGHINYEVRAARPEDLKLEHMRAFLARLGNPQDRLRIVHITGTKGKGSTAAMLASIARAAGYRVGLFTSPHLVHIEERIQIDGVPISEAELVALMTEIEPLLDVTPAPTFFEIGTALGFLHFVRRRVDLAFIEVGLGGRFDSTNVCKPLVTVVTSIGLDHVAQLGNTLEAIAYQKAGILKRGVPCVSGVTQAGPRGVIRAVAAEVGAGLVEVERRAGSVSCRIPGESESRIRQLTLPARLNLLGEHQATNAALAVATVEHLQRAGFHLPPASIAVGLATVHWPARIEVLRTAPTIVVDCAHNVPSAEALVATLRQSVRASGRRVCIFAVSNDKPYAEMLTILAGYFGEFHLTRYGQNPRCVPPEALAALLPATVARTIHATSLEAWQIASGALGCEDLLCITGSVFLAGELRPRAVDFTPSSHEQLEKLR